MALYQTEQCQLVAGFYYIARTAHSSKLGAEELSYSEPKHWQESEWRKRDTDNYTEKDGQSSDWLGEGDSGNGAVITINKQNSLYLGRAALTDLPQMNEQSKHCVVREEFVIH